MAIEFVCPTCNGTLQVGDDAAGRVVRCGGCLSTLRVPAADSSTHGPPASPFETEPPPRRTRPPRNESPDDRPRRRRRDLDEEESPDDSPRRRRDTYGEPPPPGRSAFFWLVIIGSILLMGMIGCCGGLYMLLPKEHWHTHESKAGGFNLELPAKPDHEIAKKARIALGPGAHAEGAVYYRRLEHYLVVYRDIASTKERQVAGSTDEQELDLRVQRFLGATGAKLPTVREKGITVDGFPARELEYNGAVGSYTARVIVADSRVYMVVACGSQPHDSPDVTRFLNSFQITDEHLVGEARKRQKDNKLPPPGRKNKDD